MDIDALTISNCDINTIIYLPIKEYINCKDKRFELLIDDINILLQNHEYTKTIMRWNINYRIIDWYGIIIQNGRIEILNLFFNKIENNYVKTLKLPYGLKKLSISLLYINKDVLEYLILPPELKLLVIHDIIDGNFLKSLILPSKIEYLITDSNINMKELIKFSKSPEGKAKYAPIKRKYDYKKCKPFYKEICRGLIYGTTQDPILKFLQNNYQLRENILTYYNPFV